jgi:HlyD family secretion protein
MTKKRSHDSEATPRSGKVDVASLFPASALAGSKGARRRLRTFAMAVAGLVVVAVVGAGVAMAASGSDTTRYRTTTASEQSVAALLNGVATIQPVSQASVAFPVSGTVAGVNVKPGDTVAVGQPLAALDTTTLNSALDQDQAALDQANLALSQALAGKNPGLPGSGGSVQSVVYRTGNQATATLLAAVTEASTDPDVAAAQQAVLDAQKKVDSTRTDAASALTAATKVCAAVGVDAGTADPSATTASINACQTALNDVVTAQSAVNDAQTALASASTALDALLQKIASTPPPTTTPPTTQPPATTAPPTTQPSPTTTQPPAPKTTEPTPTTTPPATPNPSAPGGNDKGGPPSSTPSPTDTTTTVPGASKAGGASGRTGGGGGTTSRSGSSSGASRSSGSSAAAAKPPSAADLVAYQSAVDEATANVTMAQQAIAQATIVSPIAGTVVAVNLAPGDSATAASTTQNVVIAGNGGFEATTTISLTHIPQVAVGQSATVNVDGVPAPLSGKVVSISPVPTSASTTTTSYGVVISLPPNATGLREGAIGTAQITTASSAKGLAVPTSAITTTGNVHTVTVLNGDQTAIVPVQVGVMGDTWTQITGGLQAGQVIVLANLDQSLPQSATQTQSTSGGKNNTTTFVIGGRTIQIPTRAIPGRG